MRKNLKNLKVLTPSGYEYFKGIRKLRKPVIKIYTETHEIRVTHDHPFVVDGKKVVANTLKFGSVLEIKDNKKEHVVNIVEDGETDVYDLIGVNGDSVYYANDILVHNCFHEGTSVVDDSYLEELKAQCKDPLLVDDNGSYRVYELPQEGHLYVVGVDVGEGIGRTNSVAQVYDVTDPTAIIQVAVYANNNVSPYHFGTKVMGIMNDWGRPPCLIENNNDGKQVIDVLIHTHNYENLVTYQLDGMSKHYNNAGRYGIHSHSNTKYKGIANFRYWTNSLKAVRFYDLDTLLEMHNVVKLPNYTFGKRKTDDLDDRVLATVWGLFILDPSLAVKHFLIEEADAQGRPLKIKHLYNNESIKNSPLLQGKISVGPKGNARVNVSPCYIGNQETAHLSDEQQLFIWLHQDGAFKEEVPEIKDVGLLDDTSEVINHFPAMIF